MTTRIFGSGIRRREDPRLITGRATYTDDIILPGTAHAAILRSPHAHARIKRIDTTKASASDASSPSTPAPTPTACSSPFPPLGSFRTRTSRLWRTRQSPRTWCVTRGTP